MKLFECLIGNICGILYDLASEICKNLFLLVILEICRIKSKSLYVADEEQ